MIALIDYGIGNLRSVEKALQAACARAGRDPALVRLVDTPAEILAAEKVVLPGVGAFGDGMRGLQQRSLVPALQAIAQRGTPLLGICLGMQLLFESSDEAPGVPGLGLLPGTVRRFTLPGLKVPQTGWNEILPVDPAPLLAGLPPGSYAYFNHSYYCDPARPDDWLAAAEYGLRYACAVQRGSLCGLQFHPEKSQEVGLRILQNFVEWLPAAPASEPAAAAYPPLMPPGEQPFTIYPAIDLRRGQVVRLFQGDPAQQTAYADDPAAAARRWISAGVRWLHVVNLDGAFGAGEQDIFASPNGQALRAILAAAGPAGVQVQFGGGLRSLPAIAAVLEAGVSRAILGSLAVQAPEFAAQAVERFGPQRIALGIDVRAGQVRIHGWTEAAAIDPVALGQQFARLGLRTCIYTEISRDGSGLGLDIAATQRFAAATGLEVIASGGAASLDDVQAAHKAGLPGVILGKALYEGRINLEEALQWQIPR